MDVSQNCVKIVTKKHGLKNLFEMVKYQTFRIDGKEIFPQQFGNTEQQLRVDAVVVENAVAGAAMYVQLLR